MTWIMPQSISRIIIDENIYYHALDLRDPWNRPDKTSFFCLIEIKENNCTALMNDEILSRISKILDNYSSREKEGSTSTAIMNVIKYCVINRKMERLNGDDTLDPPTNLKEDDYDFYFLAKKTRETLLSNDLPLFNVCKENNVPVLFSCELLIQFKPSLLNAPDLDHPLWLVIDTRLLEE